MALIGTNCIRGHTPMRRGPELAEHAERAEVLDVHTTHFEDVVRTHLDTLSFRFAAPVVDDRPGCHVLIPPLQTPTYRGADRTLELAASVDLTPD
jgi:hypothetical protein